MYQCCAVVPLRASKADAATLMAVLHNRMSKANTVDRAGSESCLLARRMEDYFAQTGSTRTSAQRLTRRDSTTAWVVAGG